MKRIRTIAIVALLLCLAPLISVVIAGSIASHYGCTLHEGFANPCVVGGRDIGETLYAMGVMGWLMLATIPIGAAVLAAWIVTEIVAWIRARKAQP